MRDLGPSSKLIASAAPSTVSWLADEQYMPTDLLHAAPTNPFSAARLAPSRAQGIHFSSEEVQWALAGLFQRRRTHVIVGPHGSGKSTWLRLLQRRIPLTRPESRVHWWDAERRPISSIPVTQTARGFSIVLVDGLDCLASYQVIALWIWAHRNPRHRVLGTTHRSMPGWHVLRRQASSLEMAERIVAGLVREYPRSQHPPTCLIHRLFCEHRGNVRSVLFDLYDWWEYKQGRVTHVGLLPPELRTALGARHVATKKAPHART